MAEQEKQRGVRMTIKGAIFNEVMPDARFKKEGVEQKKDIIIYQDQVAETLAVKVPLTYKAEKHVVKSFDILYSKGIVNGKPFTSFHLVA